MSPVSVFARLGCLAAGLLMTPMIGLSGAVHAASPASATKSACDGPLNYRTKTLSGQPTDLCQYQGKVVLVVNTASYCGFTNQYEGLQSLYDTYKDRGLVVLGVPSNDFGAQEPGSNEQVKDFCERTYKVKFPMLEKSVVVGKDANPLHRQLAEATGQPPRWNFHKYLIDRTGKPVSAFGSRVAPLSDELKQSVERLLASNSAPKS
ncbi:MAG: glutathione peroxidase [Burkholderiales bacterium]|nr:glutathione peroxidase [Burkholderiales bacterium]